MTPTVQWQGDNLPEVEHFLRDHLARADQDGKSLLIRGIGLNITLSLGDSMVLDGDRLGVQRLARAEKETYVTWKGDNVAEIATFMSAYKMQLMTYADKLCVLGAEAPIVLARGDRLIKRNGQVVVSFAGVDHANG